MSPTSSGLRIGLSGAGSLPGARRGHNWATRPQLGSDPKLASRWIQAVLDGMARSPPAFGNETDPRTAGGLAEGTAEECGVRSNAYPLARLPTERGHSPRKPEVRAVDWDEPAIARRVAEDLCGSKSSPPKSSPQ